jgi:hypothetical protein
MLKNIWQPSKIVSQTILAHISSLGRNSSIHSATRANEGEVNMYFTLLPNAALESFTYKVSADRVAENYVYG